MNSKSLLIAVAALALTATGAQAYSSQALSRAGLSQSQVAAFEVARELKAEGDIESARNVLVEAGINESTLEKVRKAMSEHHHTGFHGEIVAAIENDDFEAFKIAVANLPIADLVTSKEDFDQLKTAHELKSAGEYEAAYDQLVELGLPIKSMHGYSGKMMRGLSEEQREALVVARAANDKETMKAILAEAGITHMKKFGDTKRGQGKQLRDGSWIR